MTLLCCNFLWARKSSCVYTAHIRIYIKYILPSVALKSNNINVISAYYPKHIRLWFGLHESAWWEQQERRDEQRGTHRCEHRPMLTPDKNNHAQHTYTQDKTQMERKKKMERLALTQWHYVLCGLSSQSRVFTQWGVISCKKTENESSKL